MTRNPHSCWWILSVLSVEPPTNLFLWALPSSSSSCRVTSVRAQEWQMGWSGFPEGGRERDYATKENYCARRRRNTSAIMKRKENVPFFLFERPQAFFYRDFPDEVMQNVSMMSAWIGHVLFWPNICPSLCGREGDKELPRNCSMT